MSAKPNMSARAKAPRRAGSAHPLARDLVRQSRGYHRAPRRRHHLSAAEGQTRRLSGAAHRSPASLGRGRARPRLHGGARQAWRLAPDQLRAVADFDAGHCVRLAGARPLGREADRHSVRQFDRPCADRVRRALCRHSLLSGIAGLFAGVARLRQARLPDEAADAGPRVRRGRLEIRRRARWPT